MHRSVVVSIRISCFSVACYFFFAAAAAATAEAQSPTFVVPPRSIADITAILDQEKPDSDKFAKHRAVAEAQPPRGVSPATLYTFHLERGYARAELGRQNEAREDGERAIQVGRQAGLEFRLIMNARRFVALQHLLAGEFKKAREKLSEMEKDLPSPTARVPGLGAILNNYRWTISALINLGDLAQAEGYMRRLANVYAISRGWPGAELYGPAYESEYERARADLASAKGQYREAEAAYRRSIAAVRKTIGLLPRWPRINMSTTKEQFENRLDYETGLAAMAKASQGRLGEAEADIRSALLNRLRSQGKYATTTAEVVARLGKVIAQQGRYAEAEQLTRIVLEIRRTIGVDLGSESIVGDLRQLSTLATLQQRYSEAARFDAEIDSITASWEPRRREAYQLDSDRIYSLMQIGQPLDAIAAAQRLAQLMVQRKGETHADTAKARGMLALALAKMGHDVEAIAEFRRAVPTLLASARTTDLDESAVVAMHSARIRDIIEGYVEVLSRSPADAGSDPASEAFRLLDDIRGRSVQQAVSASAARMVARDNALAQLVRRDQDNDKQLGAHIGLVNNILARPSSERDDDIIRQLNAEIDKLRVARNATRTEIARKFPSYAELIDPKPPTPSDIRSVLFADEAVVTFYFGRNKSYVWALPKDGPLAFATIAASRAEIESKITILRKALDPDVDTIAKIPAFELGIASDLYELLLKPVEAGWKGAKSLIVITNGALGLLPLSVLPTERVAIELADEPAFVAYRKAPWLVRTHSVTLMPSAAALQTLRQLPAGSGTREALIGFGDPFFSETQAAEADRPDPKERSITAADSVTLRRRTSPRKDQIDSADLARLPRLPDTADELKAVASALRADPTRALRLGRAAHEQAVERADLARYRIVAFATHGLLPGDLNGLTQPALALTAPKVAGIDGDGLLTMEEILALKLDADWVVLSACNTGAGSSEGAEALSGLGRAFFYAGTRSLLITNWSVESVSARELVSDLFKRQSDDPSMPRGEALRQAMIALLDNGGYVEGGQVTYSYAHPLFWAPYSIIGEGGR